MKNEKRKDYLKLVEKLQSQKGIKIDYELIEGASHFYEKEMKQVDEITAAYVDRRRAEIAAGIGDR